MNNLSSQNVNGPTAVNNTVGLATNPNNSNTSRILPTEMPGSTQTSLSGVLHPGKLPSTQVGSSTSPMGISNSSTATFLQNWNLLPSHIQQQFLQQHQRALNALLPQGTSLPTNTATQGIEFRWREAQKRTPRDKEDQILQEIRGVLPHSKLFGRLLAFEKYIDSHIKKRQIHIAEALPRTHNQTATQMRKLLMCISHTFENTEALYLSSPKESLPSRGSPSWTLRIEGYLMDDPRAKPTTPKKFSSFFRKIFIQLDKDLYPDNWCTEWNRDNTLGEWDGFEVKRRGDKESIVHIFLHLDYKPQRYKVAPALANLLKLHDNYTKTHIILSLWQYIRQQKLQDPEHRSTVILDEPLRQIFGCQKIDYMDVPKLLQPLLGPPEPIQLSYQIRLSRDPTATFEQWYEVPVDVETLPFQVTLPSLNKPELEELNQKIMRNIQKINEHKKKRNFFLEFASNPRHFIDDFISSQIRDYKIARAFGRDTEEERHASYYMQPLTRDAVKQYLNKIPVAVPQERPLLSALTPNKSDGQKDETKRPSQDLSTNEQNANNMQNK
jgi:SWI/SNF-related matrix-associated actin-dependent regulator of chromatin subfamily D